jgi:restriction endonuclease S subunit
MTGASGHRRVPASFYENLQVPVPTIADQKRFLAVVEQYESAIAQAKVTIESALSKKQAIMEQHL